MLTEVSLDTQVAASPANPYVLLVDDHVPSLMRLSQIVEGAGYPCATAASAAEAVTHCDARRPQVVVTDFSMPNLDGHGLACWLKSRYPSVPLLLMTGHSLDASDLASLNRTFIAVLPKPLDLDQLLCWLARVMPKPGFSSQA